MNTFDKEQRRMAKEKDHYLFAWTLEGRHRDGSDGRTFSKWEVSGPLPPECWDEFFALYKKWEAEDKI